VVSSCAAAARRRLCDLSAPHNVPLERLDSFLHRASRRPAVRRRRAGARNIDELAIPAHPAWVQQNSSILRRSLMVKVGLPPRLGFNTTLDALSSNHLDCDLAAALTLNSLPSSARIEDMSGTQDLMSAS